MGSSVDSTKLMEESVNLKLAQQKLSKLKHKEKVKKPKAEQSVQELGDKSSNLIYTQLESQKKERMGRRNAGRDKEIMAVIFAKMMKDIDHMCGNHKDHQV